MFQVEVLRTEVSDEDVRAGMKDQWFHVHVYVGEGVQMVDQKV